MPQFNPDKITKLVSEMRRAVDRLNSLKMLEKDEFLNDPDKIGSAKYSFIVAIESAIDICNHIISQNGYRVAEDYADIFQVMQEQNVFNAGFAGDLKEMARFRNRLIHLYIQVDDEQFYDILRTRLRDFKIFMNAISVFLKLDNL